MPDRDEIIERLASLEAKEEARDKHDAARDKLIADMAADQKEILAQLNRYKGAWGVVVMVTGAIWAAITFVFPLVTSKGGGG